MILSVSKKIWLAAFLEITVLANLGSLLSYGGQLATLSTYAQLSTFDTLSIACNAIGAYNDIAIAIVLAYVLQQQKTGFKKTTHMINRIIMYSLNTGLITAFFGIATLIATVSSGDTLIFAIFFFTGSRIYANSLLAILNLRNRIREEEASTLHFTSLGRLRTTGLSSGETQFNSQGIERGVYDQDTSKELIPMHNVSQNAKPAMPLSITLDTQTTSATDYQTTFPLRGTGKSEDKVYSHE